MENRAAWFADTEGRRIGNLEFVVNKILQPRSRLTGAGQGAPLSFRESQGLEGRELKGQTRARTTLNIPTANSPQVQQALKDYEAGKLGPQFTEKRIQSAIEKAQGNLTRGQAIIMIQQSIRALQQKKAMEQQRKGFKSREGARQDVRENVLGPLKQQGQ